VVFLPALRHGPGYAGAVPQDTLLVHEIYASIQGESRFAGLPCTFIRLAGCNLRCRWCDTPEARTGGEPWRRGEVLREALAHPTPLVELTGGEPLLQPGAYPLLAELCDAGRTVLLETNGTVDVSEVDPRVCRIMDLKAPGSGQCEANRYENIARLTDRDEIKVVLAGRADYDWMKATIVRFQLDQQPAALAAACVMGSLEPRDLAAWVLRDGLHVCV
jgi:7-carboxy-7-deazaguanine synthase